MDTQTIAVVEYYERSIYMDKTSAFDLFKEEIDSLCEDTESPCTKGDLLEAMKRVFELLHDLNQD